MKKSIILSTIALMALTACQQYELKDVESRLFTFHVKGAFSTNYEDMSRAAVRLEEDNTAGITDLWVLDYVDGTLKNQVHQKPSDEDFGHPSLALAYGTHNIKFIASKGETPALTTTALAWAKVLDTFTLDYPVTVTSSSNVNRSPELHRSISCLRVNIEDKIATGTATIDIGYDRSSSLTLPSLSEGTHGWKNQTFTIPSTWIGAAGSSLSTYTLCSSTYTTDVSIVARDDNGNILADVTVEDVELRNNRATVLSGSLFCRDKDFSVSLAADWDDPIEISF